MISGVQRGGARGRFSTPGRRLRRLAGLRGGSGGIGRVWLGRRRGRTDGRIGQDDPQKKLVGEFDFRRNQVPGLAEQFTSDARLQTNGEFAPATPLGPKMKSPMHHLADHQLAGLAMLCYLHNNSISRPESEKPAVIGVDVDRDVAAVAVLVEERLDASLEGTGGRGTDILYGNARGSGGFLPVCLVGPFLTLIRHGSFILSCAVCPTSG